MQKSSGRVHGKHAHTQNVCEAPVLFAEVDERTSFSTTKSSIPDNRKRRNFRRTHCKECEYAQIEMDISLTDLQPQCSDVNEDINKT